MNGPSVSWIVLLAFLLARSVALADIVGGAVLHQRFGDDPRWAAPDWADADWAPGNVVPARSGVHWVRCRFTLQANTRPRLLLPAERPAGDVSGLEGGRGVDCVFMAAPYCYELYWDGRLLGRSGLVGTSLETEKTGLLDHVFFIPEELRNPGEHVVAIRMSSFHYNFAADSLSVAFLLSNFAGHFAAEIQRPVFPLIGMGGALLVGLISAVLYWLMDHPRPLLLCSLVSFALALFYLLIAWRWLHDDPYEWFCPRLVAITWAMTLIAALFPWLLLEQFTVSRPVRWLVALLPLLAVAWQSSPLYEIKALWLCRAMLAISLLIAAWAVWRHRAGAWFVLCGVLAGLLLVRADRRDFLNPWFFAIFSALVLYLFTMLGLQLRSDRRRAQGALLTAARLETELLKKNLQPHFLLNTLTALSEVIEQDPSSAVRLIEDMAEEFRSLAKMSGEKLVPLEQELGLCAAHLRVIACRTGKKLSLVTGGIDGKIPVPPALFLTLIENGLVHQRPEGGAEFQLHAVRTGTGARFVFLSPGPTRAPHERAIGGTGLKYVKARLDESFPGRWSFSQGPSAQGWQTVIDVTVAIPVGGGT